MIARLAAALVASAPFVFAAHAGERDGGCLGAAAVDRALVEGRATRLARIARGLDGEIVRAELCEDGDRLVYRVTLLDGRGSVRRLVLDARSGRLVYDGRRP